MDRIVSEISCMNRYLALSLSFFFLFFSFLFFFEEDDDERDQCQIKILKTGKKRKPRERRVKGKIRNTCVRWNFGSYLMSFRVSAPACLEHSLRDVLSRRKKGSRDGFCHPAFFVNA